MWKKRPKIPRGVHVASGSFLFWGQHSACMAALFGRNEGMSWNKGGCIVSVSHGSKVVSKESLVTSFRDSHAWECACSPAWIISTEDSLWSELCCCQFSEALLQRSPAVNRGHGLKLGPSWSRDSILHLWKMRLWMDVRGYLRLGKGPEQKLCMRATASTLQKATFCTSWNWMATLICGLDMFASNNLCRCW